LCVGDIVDGPGDVDKCIRLLSENNVLTVLGNHDRWYLENTMRDLRDATTPKSLNKLSTQYLKELPETKELTTISGELLLCHGLDRNDMARLTPDDYGYGLEANVDLQNLIHQKKYKYIINGHTHYRMVRNINGLTIINAGTLSHLHNPCFLLADWEKQIVTFFDIKEDLSISEGEICPLDSINCK
jgi:predicted phosphodiesterase